MMLHYGKSCALSYKLISHHAARRSRQERTMKPCRTVCLMVVGLSAVAYPLPLAADEDVHQILAIARAVYRETSDVAFRKLLRDSVYDKTDDARLGLRLDKDWQRAAAKSPQLPVVVLIHGFNSTVAHNVPIMAPVHAAGFPTASFSYPNDWNIADSAAVLSNELRAFAKAHPNRKIAIVTHSMGGLVARACLEDPQLDPGNVTRLLMIAPPSQGTLLAHTAIGADLWEHWLTPRDGSAWTRWRDSVVDGLGEATDDLVPGSPFLTKLNARPRNPRIRYSIFLGTHSPLSAGDMNYLRWTLHRAGSRVEGLSDFIGPLDRLVADMDEVIDGKGDGVVAVKRGQLDGVADVLLLPFDHLSCTGKPEDAAVRRLQKEILVRLR
jgi:pimeloyl-ACP methyl ester carboxylesterase